MPHPETTLRGARAWQKPTMNEIHRKQLKIQQDQVIKQIMADAIGSLFSVAEQVSVCFYCGSTQHDLHDCQDPAKPMIQKMLKEMKDRLTVEDPRGRTTEYWSGPNGAHG